MSAVRSRLTKAEGSLGDALLWFEIQKLAADIGGDPKELYQEARDLIDRYWHLAKPLPGGTLDIEPVLRAMADDEHLDYDELLHDVKRMLRQWRRRESRRRK